jgi:hypothetical protein
MEHFRASFGVLADYHHIHSVPDLTDRTALNFGGLSGEFRWQLMHRDISPVGLTLSFAPQWQRIDDIVGQAGGKLRLSHRTAGRYRTRPEQDVRRRKSYLRASGPHQQLPV